MTTQQRVGMPMDEFIRLYDEAPFELIDGERMPIMPPVFEHGEIVQVFLAALFMYKQSYASISIYTDLPFVLTDTRSWVKGSRVPDVMVYASARLAEYKAQTKGYDKKPIILVPDLCIEIVSHTDLYVDIDKKVESYLKDGVLLTWVVNPALKTVAVYSAENIIRLTENDTLQGGDVLPDFSLPVRDIFTV